MARKLDRVHTNKQIHWEGCSLIGATRLVDQYREATLIQGKAKALMNEYSNPSDTFTIFANFTGISGMERAHEFQTQCQESRECVIFRENYQSLDYINLKISSAA